MKGCTGSHNCRTYQQLDERAAIHGGGAGDRGRARERRDGAGEVDVHHHRGHRAARRDPGARDDERDVDVVLWTHMATETGHGKRSRRRMWKRNRRSRRRRDKEEEEEEGVGGGRRKEEEEEEGVEGDDERRRIRRRE